MKQLKILLLITTLLFIPIATASVEQLISSYSYDYSNGTINVTSFSSYLMDLDANGANDTLMFNLTTDFNSTASFLAFVDVDNGESVLTGSHNKTLSPGNTYLMVNFSTLLFAQHKFNYTVRIYDFSDALVYRKSNLTTSTFGDYEEGYSIISVSDQNVANTYLRITSNINSTANIYENITVFMKHNDTTISASKEAGLSIGAQNVDIDFDNETIKGTHYNGKFLIESIQIGSKVIGISANTTNSYDYEDFAKTSYIRSIASSMIDNNSNNLTDYLAINFTIDFKSNDDYTIKSKLYDSFDNFIADMEKNITLSTGINTVSINVSGQSIYKSYLDGPYLLSFAELLIDGETQDYIQSPYQTIVSYFQDFERPPLPDIKVSVGVINISGNDSIEINVTNQGESAAVNIFIDILDNSTFSRTLSIPNLNTSETRILETNNTINSKLYIAVADFSNIVDENNESNNIALWSEPQIVSLAIESLLTISSNSTLRIFGFEILNDGDAQVTDIQWQFDAEDGTVINSTENISLSANERAMVYVRHNYSDSGEFTIKANATGLTELNSVAASSSSTAEVGDLLITSFSHLSVQATKVIFEMQGKNNREENLTSMEWSLDTDSGQFINSTQAFYMFPNETTFVYIAHDYGTGGTFNTIATLSNPGYSDTESLSVTTNTGPSISAMPDVTFDEDSYNDTLNLSDYATDAEDSDSALIWNYESNNIIVSINQDTKIANISAPANWSGSESVSFIVYDTSNLTDSNSILVTVNPVNDAPSFNGSNPITNMKWPEDVTNGSLNLTPYFYDIDRDSLNYTSYGTENIEINIDNTTGIVTLSPQANWSGINYIVFAAIDPSGLTAPSNNVTLNVTPVNDAPVFIGAIPHWRWPEDTVNDSLNLTQYFSDIDEDSLEYNFTPTSNIAILINNNTGVVTLTPNGNYTGAEYMTFTAIDAESLTASSNNVTLNVTPVNDPPIIISFIPTDLTPALVIGASLLFNHTSSDIDGDILTHSWKLDNTEQSIAQGWLYEPAGNEAGLHNVTINVSDGVITVSVQWNVTVLNQTNIDVYSLSLLNQEMGAAIFGFNVNNTGENATSINWTLDTGEGQIAANELSLISPNESIFVFAAHNYTETGDYTILAEAFDEIYSDSESIQIDIYDLEMANVSVLNISSTSAVFELALENFLQSNLTNVSWAFDTKDGSVINSTSILILQPEEAAFVYVSHNFSTTGSYNVNATAINGTLTDSRNLSVIV